MKHLLIPQLKKLVSIDTSIRTLMQHIEDTTNQIDEVQKTLNGLEQTITLLREEKADAKKNVAEQELEAQLLRDQEVAAREHLENVESHKAYELQLKELSVITAKRQDFDDVIIKAWHELERAEKKIAAELPEYMQRQDALHAERNSLEQKLTTLTTDLEKHELERKTASEAVPEEWLTRYTRMRLRVQDPIVPLAETHCSACYYGVPRQEVTNLKREHLIICRNCYRFIYQADETVTFDT